MDVLNSIGTFLSANNELGKRIKCFPKWRKKIKSNNVAMAIKFDHCSDKRRYTLSYGNIAIVFHNTDGKVRFERDLVIDLRSDTDGPRN